MEKSDRTPGRHNDMLDHRDSEKSARVLQLGCKIDVMPARSEVSGRVVVGKDDGLGIVEQGFLEDGLRVDYHGIDAASGNLQLPQQTMATVDEEGHELFRGLGAVLASEIFSHLIDRLKICL